MLESVNINITVLFGHQLYDGQRDVADELLSHKRAGSGCFVIEFIELLAGDLFFDPEDLCSESRSVPDELHSLLVLVELVQGGVGVGDGTQHLDLAQSDALLLPVI